MSNVDKSKELIGNKKVDLRKISGKEKAQYKKAYKQCRIDQYNHMRDRQPTVSELAIITRRDEIKALHEVA